MKTHNSNDPIVALAQKARLENAPSTDVTDNVLRQIRVQNTILTEKPLMWLTLGSTATALIVALICTPALLTLMDPLNTLFQSNPGNLL